MTTATPLTRLERHYMIEADLTFYNRHGRYMNAEEAKAVLEKLRAKKGLTK